MNYESCGEQTRMYCPDCKVFICDSCDPSHISAIFTRNHKRYKQHNHCSSAGGGDGDGGLEMVEKKVCLNHPSEKISGFCFQCSVLVCLKCVLETHDEHRKKVKPIDESILQKRDEVIKIGTGLEKRLKVIEEDEKKIEKDLEELKEKLEKKRVEKKELGLEKEDLKIRRDSILRLSNTLSDISLFDDQHFSTLLQTANEIVFEVGPLLLPKNSTLSKKGEICCDGGFRFLSSFSCLTTIYGVSVNSDGNIFVCEDGGLKVRNKEGNVMKGFQRRLDSLHLEPVDVSVKLNDQIVVLDWSQSRRRVVLLTKEGKLIRSIGSHGSLPGRFNDPYGVCVDGEGRIIVADTANHRIQVFNDDGAFIRSFGTQGSLEGQFNRPYGVVVDGDGHVVICDTYNHRIQVMDIKGNFVRGFGTEGSKESQFQSPKGLDLDGKGRIVVGDQGDERVSVFEKDGTFLFSFGKGHLKEPFGIVVDSSGSVIVSYWKKMAIEIWGVK